MKAPALALALITAGLPARAELSGEARVIDGDTIEIAGERIRLHGIDAPEIRQTCRTDRGEERMCGDLARQALVGMLQDRTVTCGGDARDRYGRWVAVCWVGRLDVNEQMVLDGWALAYRRYSDDYVRAEALARARRRRMWSGEFIPPWEWRRSRR